MQFYQVMQVIRGLGVETTSNLFSIVLQITVRIIDIRIIEVPLYRRKGKLNFCSTVKQECRNSQIYYFIIANLGQLQWIQSKAGILGVVSVICHTNPIFIASVRPGA